MSTEFICEYCKTKLNNIKALNKHQRVSKYCLVIQGKIEDKKKKREEEREQKEKERERIRKEKEEEKERIEREKEKEKEEKRENRHRCEYCKVKFTTRTNLCGHLDICLEKYKKIIEDKEKIIEKNKIEKKKEKEKILKPTPITNIGPAPSTLKKPLVLNDMTIDVDPVSLMINATQMCKAAGKLFANYKQLDGTKDYLQALESVIGIPITELIKVVQGGNSKEQGTWVHRLVAVHLAQWLSPSFAVQVSLWVNELMITGKVELGNELSNEAIDDKWRIKLNEEKEKYILEANRCKDLELTINQIEEDKIKKEEYEKKKIIDDLNTTISVFSTETKSNLNFHKEKEVIYLGYIGNFLFKYGQSSNFKDRLGTHEKSTSYEKFEIVKVFTCKNPVVSERRVREWVRKNKLEYEYKTDGETARGQREIIKVESKEMLERVCKAMQKYSNLSDKKTTDVEVEIKRIEAEIEIKKTEAEVEIKKTEAEVEIKKTEAEVEIKRMNLLESGKINFDQYIQLKNKNL